jgi:hypothetical protein
LAMGAVGAASLAGVFVSSKANANSNST